MDGGRDGLGRERGEPVGDVRLGRNLAHLVNTVQDLAARGVGLRVLAGQGAQVDTTTAGGRLVLPASAASSWSGSTRRVGGRIRRRSSRRSHRWTRLDTRRGPAAGPGHPSRALASVYGHITFQR